VKRADLERHLREHGCRFVGEGSSHAKWRGPTGRPSTIPRHHEIKPGTVRAVCRQLEVPIPPSVT
jgi:predicted RNA binding protein YcfA (HicA-like mRNA interferase family)